MVVLAATRVIFVGALAYAASDMHLMHRFNTS